MAATNFAVVDTEIGAAKEFAPRMAEISNKTTALLADKRKNIAELETTKKDLLAEVEARATKSEEIATALRSKYVSLHNWASRAAESSTPGGFQRDPLAEPSKSGAPAPAPTVNVAATIEAAAENIVTSIVAFEAGSGIVAFSVGQDKGLQEKSSFYISVGGKEIGRVLITTVKGSLSYGQLQPGKELNLSALAKAQTVTLTPSNKLAAAQ